MEFTIDNILWKIPSDGLEGFDFTDITVSTENKVIGDGAYITSKRIPSVDRTIKAILLNKSLNETMRQVARSFFNAKHRFKTYLTYGNITRWCDGELFSIALPTKNIYANLELSITMLCGMPYMLSYDDFAQNIAEVTPRFGFPFISLVGKGFVFSEFKFSKEVLIANDGDVETYCKAVLVAKGEVTNPVLKKDEKFIRILDTMEQGDVIEIDLTKQPVSISKNGENIIRLTDRRSSFNDMVFDVGNNTIGYDADLGNNVLDVTIYFNKRYLGI